MSTLVDRRAALFGPAVLAVAVLAGCARPQVHTVEPYAGGMLPRPNHVLVSYFSVSPEEIRLDQGISARIRRQFDDQPPDAALMQAARETQGALAMRLVQKLQSYGLPAELAGAYQGPGTALLVHGQIVGIDQGNRTRRVLIGLGAGKSSVTADTQLYYVTAPAAVPRFVTAYEGSADSGRMPGAVGTMGAGAAAHRVETSAVLSGGAHAYGESDKATDTAEAGNLANAIAHQVGQFAVMQGWIPPAAMDK